MFCPFTYRGYYYDTETGFYYLNSRYYDPVVGRFLNADGYVSTGQGILGNNMYAYCGNTPVMNVDHSGCEAVSIFVATFVVTLAATLLFIGNTNFIQDLTEIVTGVIKFGSRYHILNNGKHSGDHILPGEMVPEP